MNKSKRAESHTSAALAALLTEITPQEQSRMDKRMLLAVKIDDAIKAKGWSNKRFAEEIGQQPSVISKWLSGTHNFTLDTLSDIEEKLGIELIALTERVWKVTKVVEYRTVATGAIPLSGGYFHPYSTGPAIDTTRPNKKIYSHA